jgi:hypothetical protein
MQLPNSVREVCAQPGKHKKEKHVAQTEPQVFNDITSKQFAKLVEKAKSAGIHLAGNSGTASQFGVEIAWSYAADKQELKLHCLHTPFFIKPEEVNAKIQALVNESL